MIYKGAFTALITPFKKGAIDLESYREIIKHQISNNIHGLVILGSTGESMCLSYEERRELISLSVEQSNKQIPVVVGVGSNNTLESIKLSQQAQDLGASALMAVMPYYNKPSKEGVYHHFRQIAENIDIPLMLYNVPARTCSDIADETVALLSEIDNIFALKDASGDINRVSRYKKINKKLLQFCGEDDLICQYYSSGGDGSISVISNAMPKEWSGVYTEFKKGGDEYKGLFSKCKILLSALSCDSNPVPIKYVLYKMGMCNEEYRLPLVKLSEANKLLIDKALNKLGLV
ncbi:MAG: 4-hydroxy-tetrahydrodipicolinate synthase [Rickettsiales bacterium]